MLEKLTGLIDNKALFTNDVKRAELHQYPFENSELSLVNTSLPSYQVAALGITRPHPPRLQVTELDEGENVLTRDASRLSSVPVYKDQFLMYSPTAWSEP